MKKVLTIEEKVARAAERQKKAIEQMSTNDMIVLRYIGECTLELLSTGEVITADSLLAFLKQQDCSENQMMQMRNEAAQSMLLATINKNI